MRRQDATRDKKAVATKLAALGAFPAVRPPYERNEVGRQTSDDAKITTGQVDLGKRLRPNMRDRQMVLYVAPQEDGWLAQRVVS